MPKISFLIATKNRSRVLKAALQSLIEQTEPDWEALVVDNGDDESEQVVSAFNDKRFRYFRPSPAHGCGASSARNFGAMFARSELVGILDSDDLAYPNRVEVTLKAFKKDPDLDVFYGNLDVWNEQHNVVYERPLKLGPPTVDQMKQFYFIPHSTVALKRNVLLSNPYNQFFKIAEDYELMSRLCSQGKKFAYTKEKILLYRVNDDNISIGKDKMPLVKLYDTLVKMVRGWIDFDAKIVEQIEEIESKK